MVFAWKEEYIVMQNFLKKSGIILGHVVCVLILLYCFANTNEIIPDESKTVNTEGFPSIEPTAAVTKMPTGTATPVGSNSNGNCSYYSDNDTSLDRSSNTNVVTGSCSYRESFSCANPGADD